MTLVMKEFTMRLSWKPKPNQKPRLFLQNLQKLTDRKHSETVTTLSHCDQRLLWRHFTLCINTVINLLHCCPSHKQCNHRIVTKWPSKNCVITYRHTWSHTSGQQSVYSLPAVILCIIPATRLTSYINAVSNRTFSWGVSEIARQVNKI